MQAVRSSCFAGADWCQGAFSSTFSQGKSPKKLDKSRKKQVKCTRAIILSGDSVRKPLEDDGVADEQLADELRPQERRQNRSRREPSAFSDDTTGAPEADAKFQRTQNRTSVRRRAVHSRARRILLLILVLAAFAAIGVGFWQARAFLLHNPRFLVQNVGAIEVQGNAAVAASDVQRIFRADVGSSIFSLPLAARKAQIEQIPWVQRATVMRLWPNRLRVSLVERIPVVYARDGDSVHLMDAEGVLLPMPDGGLHLGSYPIVNGAWASDAAARARKLQPCLQFLAALDAQGNSISQQISEVDIRDPEDVRALVSGGEGGILVHFGKEKFLARYQAFAAHRAEWLRMYPHLASVDMRYGRQVVLDMTPGTSVQTVPQSAPQTSGAAQTPPNTEVQ